MKKFLITLFSIIALGCVAQYVTTAGAAAYPPALGGTGTSTIPLSGQTLIGNASNTYTPAYIGCSGNCTVATSSGGITISVPPVGSSTITIFPVSVATSTFTIIGDGTFINVTNPGTSTIKLSLTTSTILNLVSASLPVTYNNSTGQIACPTCITTSTNNFGGITGNATATDLGFYTGSSTITGVASATYTSSTNTLNINVGNVTAKYFGAGTSPVTGDAAFEDSNLNNILYLKLSGGASFEMQRSLGLDGLGSNNDTTLIQELDATSNSEGGLAFDPGGSDNITQMLVGQYNGQWAVDTKPIGTAKFSVTGSSTISGQANFQAGVNISTVTSSLLETDANGNIFSVTGTAYNFPFWNASGTGLTATSSIVESSTGLVSIGTSTASGTLYIVPGVNTRTALTVAGDNNQSANIVNIETATGTPVDTIGPSGVITVAPQNSGAIPAGNQVVLNIDPNITCSNTPEIMKLGGYYIGCQSGGGLVIGMSGAYVWVGQPNTAGDSYAQFSSGYEYAAMERLIINQEQNGFLVQPSSANYNSTDFEADTTASNPIWIVNSQGAMGNGNLKYPTGVTATASSTAGSMASGTWYAEVMPVDSYGNIDGGFPSVVAQANALMSNTTTSFNLTWNAVTGATSYRISVGTSSTNTYLSTSTTGTSLFITTSTGYVTGQTPTSSLAVSNYLASGLASTSWLSSYSSSSLAIGTETTSGYKFIVNGSSSFQTDLTVPVVTATPSTASGTLYFDNNNQTMVSSDGNATGTLDRTFYAAAPLTDNITSAQASNTAANFATSLTIPSGMWHKNALIHVTVGFQNIEASTAVNHTFGAALSGGLTGTSTIMTSSAQVTCGNGATCSFSTDLYLMLDTAPGTNASMTIMMDSAGGSQSAPLRANAVTQPIAIDTTANQTLTFNVLIANNTHPATTSLMMLIGRQEY